MEEESSCKKRCRVQTRKDVLATTRSKPVSVLILTYKSHLRLDHRRQAKGQPDHLSHCPGEYFRHRNRGRCEDRWIPTTARCIADIHRSSGSRRRRHAGVKIFRRVGAVWGAKCHPVVARHERRCVDAAGSDGPLRQRVVTTAEPLGPVVVVPDWEPRARSSKFRKFPPSAPPTDASMVKFMHVPSDWKSVRSYRLR